MSKRKHIHTTHYYDEQVEYTHHSTAHEVQCERLKSVSHAVENAWLEWFDELPGHTDRDKTVYLLLKVGLSPERVAIITNLSRRTIERKMQKGF